MYPDGLKEKLDHCLGCADPKCMKGCPLKMEIPQIIKLVKDNDLESTRTTM